MSYDADAYKGKSVDERMAMALQDIAEALCQAGKQLDESHDQFIQMGNSLTGINTAFNRICVFFGCMALATVVSATALMIVALKM